ncbi:cysteine-rich receptor-like protein kinase, partial [Trifolium pratense]
MSGKRNLWSELLDFKLNNEKGEWVLGGDFNAILKVDERKGCNGGGLRNEREEFEGFIDKGGISGQWIGNHDISDHCPIWLLCSNLDWGPKPFKFNNCWTGHLEFNSFVTNLWRNLNINDLNIEKTLKELNDMEGMLASGGLDPNSISTKLINQKFWDQLNYKESLIKQKSRVKWVQEGDSNSRFFHASIKGRRRINRLAVLKKGDDWLQGVDEIKSAVKDHFSTFFSEEWSNRHFLNGLNFNSLSEADNVSLLEPFSEEEFKDIIWRWDGNKSPGPDGFNFNFLKSCWSTVKSDIMEFLGEFYVNATLPKAITSSFLTLIPKSGHPQSLSEYRPICLMGCLYKILSKLMASRLKRVLGKLISPCQSAFLLDFEKAYDIINWSFLERMMIKMGFAEGWMKWIRACIFNSSMLVLVNGSPTEDFKVCKGLRQGDPLSPFLFLIVAEGLTGMVKRAVEI